MYTNDDIVQTFDQASVKVAEFISVLNDLKGKFERISNQTMDNADPEIEAANCLEKLSVLLSTLVIYKNEYQTEPINEKTGEIK